MLLLVLLLLLYTLLRTLGNPTLVPTHLAKRLSLSLNTVTDSITDSADDTAAVPIAVPIATVPTAVVNEDTITAVNTESSHVPTLIQSTLIERHGRQTRRWACARVFSPELAH